LFGLHPVFIKLIADAVYRGQRCATSAKILPCLEVEIVKRSGGKRAEVALEQHRERNPAHRSGIGLNHHRSLRARTVDSDRTGDTGGA
jgi:hypothetical protein